MKVLVAILLLLHVNFSMFIAQVDEIDVYDASGHQVEDVNSLIDFLRVTFHKEKTHHNKKDSDDDNARYFHIVKLDRLFYQPFFEVLKTGDTTGLHNYPQLAESKPSAVFSETQSPPPKA